MNHKKNSITRPETDRGVLPDLLLFNGQDQKEIFMHPKLIGNGASSECYYAEKQNGTFGYLKKTEFTGNSGQRKFEEQFAKIKRKVENSHLSNFVQTGDLYYEHKFLKGKDPSVIYVWSEGVKGKSYDQMIRENYGTNDLVLILKLVCAVGASINAIHNKGIVYLDIKPDNIMVPFSASQELDSRNVSLFDLNSFQLVEDLDAAEAKNREVRILGTPGFRHPALEEQEIPEEHIRYRADLYSLGALLYYSLMYNGTSASAAFYDASKYGQIEKLLAGAALFTDFEENKPFRRRIAKVLRTMLSADSADCSWSAVNLDLEGIIQDAMQAQTRTENRESETLTDGMRYSFYSLLEDHPLYEVCANRADETLNILILGDGRYAQTFADLSLQFAQNMRNPAVITVAGPNAAEARKCYLAERPGAEDFINVNGCSLSAPCGSIYFRTIAELCPGHPQFQKKNKALNKQILAEITDALKCSYIFIALGSDSLNKSIALSLQEIYSEKAPGKKWTAAYIVEKAGERAPQKSGNTHLIPVYDANPESISDPEKDRRAFNLSISYEKGLIQNPGVKQKTFNEDKYSYYSSLNSALSIPYKLHAIGIDTDHFADRLEEIAGEYMEKVQPGRKEPTDYEKKLVQMEHCRWCCDLVSRGWVMPKGEDGRLNLQPAVIAGKARIESGGNHSRMHACLACSSEKSDLLHFSPEQWDTEGSYPPAVDALDRMSLDLHRACRKYAREQKEERESQKKTFEEKFQSMYTEADQEIWDAYKLYLLMLDGIENGNPGYEKYFSVYHEDLKYRIGKDHKSGSADLLQKIKDLENAYKPVREAVSYHDYKASDRDLISRIPFILTYKTIGSLAVVFSMSSRSGLQNEDQFANVLSATVLCPERLLYLLHFTKDKDADRFESCLNHVLDYFESRRMQMKYQIYVFCDADVSDEQKACLEALKEKFSASGRPVDIEAEVFRDEDAMMEDAAAWLAEKKAVFEVGSPFFASAYSENRFLEKIRENSIPDFEFNRETKKFENCRNCEYLKYIDAEPVSLQVKDLFALMGAKRTNDLHIASEYMDSYKELWDIYTGKGTSVCYEDAVSSWNHLSGELAEYHDEKDDLAAFSLHDREGRTGVLSRTLKKENGWKMGSTASILSTLKKYEVIDSVHAEEKTNTINIEISFDEKYRKGLEALFSNRNSYGEKKFSIVKKKVYWNEVVTVYRQVLSVIDMKYKDAYLRNEYDRILSSLEKLGYITEYTADPETGAVSFDYCSEEKKRAMIHAGAILEIYSYFKILETHYFDDVQAKWNFEWKDSGLQGEIDLICTKGTKSVFAECEPYIRLERQDYDRLSSLSSHFGVGTVPVLIAAVHSRKGTAYDDDNQKIIRYGSMFGIRTFCSDFEEIGKKIAALME